LTRQNDRHVRYCKVAYLANEAPLKRVIDPGMSGLEWSVSDLDQQSKILPVIPQVLRTQHMPLMQTQLPRHANETQIIMNPVKLAAPSGARLMAWS
jgi:hypothetical protein